MKCDDLRTSKLTSSPFLLHFHGFLTGLTKFFEDFAQKLCSETSEQTFQIDLDKVMNSSGEFFDSK